MPHDNMNSKWKWKYWNVVLDKSKWNDKEKFVSKQICSSTKKREAHEISNGKEKYCKTKSTMKLGRDKEGIRKWEKTRANTVQEFSKLVDK